MGSHEVCDIWRLNAMASGSDAVVSGLSAADSSLHFPRSSTLNGAIFAFM